MTNLTGSKCFSTAADAALTSSAQGTLSHPSLEDIVANHLGEVSRLAYRLIGWNSDVEDIVQDVFVAAAGQLCRLRQPDKIRPWLYKITINRCRTYRYKQKLWLLWVRRQPAEETLSSGPADQAHNQEQNQAVRRAVRQLPGKYREAVVLVYLEQLSIAKAAPLLGLTENALRVRLQRARGMLKDKLEFIRNDL